MTILRKLCLFLLLSLPYNSLLAIELSLPLDCRLGINCWITNLPSHNKKDKAVDFLNNSKTYSGNVGTDFTIQLNTHMKVISPINGRVKSIQDDINDISISKIDRQSSEINKCGNFVVLVQDDYEIELCHLKKNSIAVNIGDEVKIGQNLAEVGLSGVSDSPHLHVNIRRIKENQNYIEVDPFYDVQKKEYGLTPQSLWSNQHQMEKQAAQTGIIYNYGFSFDQIIPEEVRIKQNNNELQPSSPRSIIGFVDIFSVNPGDKVTLKIVDDSNKELVSKTKEFNQYQHRYFIDVSKPLYGQKLRGQYFLKINYKYKDKTTNTFTKSILLN